MIQHTAEDPALTQPMRGLTQFVAHSVAPVDEHKGMPDLLDSLIVGRVRGDKLEAGLQGDGRNHRVGPSNGLADASPLHFAMSPSSPTAHPSVAEAKPVA